MTVLSCGILLFSFSFLVEMASEDTSHGEILSRSEALRTLSRSEAFLALLIRFWLLTLELELPLEVGKGNFDLLLLVTEDSNLVTGWFEAKDVSWNWKLSFKRLIKLHLHCGMHTSFLQLWISRVACIQYLNHQTSWDHSKYFFLSLCLFLY